MEPYTSANGGPLGLGGGILHTSLNTQANRNSGGPLAYGLPNYPSGSAPPAGLLPPSGISSADSTVHASVGRKGPKASPTDALGKAPDNLGGLSASGAPLYMPSTKYLPPACDTSASLASLPGGSLSVPPLTVVTPETLEKEGGPCGSLEEFETMVGDLRRTFISWLRHTEAELKRERTDLVRRKREFEEEKRKVWALFQQDKQTEYEKIKEERRVAQAEMQQQLKQVQIERNDARAKLQVERQKFEEEKENQRRQAVLDRERFRQEVLAFESERQRVLDSSIATETVVDLNVGGVVFESSRQTLAQQKGSFLEALLSGRHHVARDRQGRIFLDRDAELFRIVLNYLRHPTTPPQPRDSAESDALAAEGAFLGIRFFPQPLLFALGGHSGTEHLNDVELLDFERQQWRPCSAMKTERAYAACSGFQNKIYVYGGQNLDYKALCDAEVYDALRDSWAPCSALNLPRRNACGASFGGRHFAIGGFDGESILASVECLDPRMRGWRQAAPLLSPRSSAMCCTHGDSLVVLGGTKGERLRTAEVYEPRMDQWQPLPCSMIEVRSAGAAVSANNHLYVLGGMDMGHQIHASLESLDPEGKQWRFLAPMPSPRMDCAAVYACDSVFVTGGQDGDVLNTTCSFSPETNQWKAGPSLITPRYGHGLILTSL